MKTISAAESSKNIIDIDTPGLFLFGDLDDYLILDHVTLVKKYVKNIQVQILKGANHFVQQDDPDTVNKYMREFLRSSQ
jgi:pimeloyl-ACP methyl ester carboxylesterase